MMFGNTHVWLWHSSMTGHDNRIPISSDHQIVHFTIIQHIIFTWQYDMTLCWNSMI